MCMACWAKDVRPTFEPTDFNWTNEQNEAELMSFVNVGPTTLPTKCPRWTNE